MIKHLENENFSNIIDKGIYLVDFYAEWCGPCKMLAPVLEEVANDRTDFEILKVDIDKHDDIAMKYGIMSVPTILIFKNGTPVKSFVGYKSKEEILREIADI